MELTSLDTTAATQNSFPYRCANPSIDKINEWFKKKLTLSLPDATSGENIKGRIIQIDTSQVDQVFLTLQSDHGKTIKISVHKDIPLSIDAPHPSFFPMVPAETDRTKIDTVTLVSEGTKYVVNKKRLMEEVPFFRASLNGSFLEANQTEQDLRHLLTSQEIGTLLDYLDKGAVIDITNWENLFCIFDRLSMNHARCKIVDFLIKEIICGKSVTDEAEESYPPLKELVQTILSLLSGDDKQEDATVKQKIGLLLKENISLSQIKTCGFRLTFSQYKGWLVKDPFLKKEEVFNVLKLLELSGATIESLSIFNVNDADIRLLIDPLTRQKTLRSLNISWQDSRMINDGLTDESADDIAKLIKALPFLEHLEIGDHQIGDEGVETIARALKESKIKTLILKCNKFTGKGFNKLIQLTKETGITFLDLTACRIGYELATQKEYVETLSHNSTLKELRLGNNSIGDNEATGLVTIIRENTALEKLDLWGNRLSEQSQRTLRNAAKKKNKLQISF